MSNNESVFNTDRHRSIIHRISPDSFYRPSKSRKDIDKKLSCKPLKNKVLYSNRELFLSLLTNSTEYLAIGMTHNEMIAFFSLVGADNVRHYLPEKKKDGRNARIEKYVVTFNDLYILSFERYFVDRCGLYKIHDIRKSKETFFKSGNPHISKFYSGGQPHRHTDLIVEQMEYVCDGDSSILWFDYRIKYDETQENTDLLKTSVVTLQHAPKNKLKFFDIIFGYPGKNFTLSHEMMEMDLDIGRLVFDEDEISGIPVKLSDILTEKEIILLEMKLL